MPGTDREVISIVKERIKKMDAPKLHILLNIIDLKEAFQTLSKRII
jgi:hypothetical protein